MLENLLSSGDTSDLGVVKHSGRIEEVSSLGGVPVLENVPESGDPGKFNCCR